VKFQFAKEPQTEGIGLCFRQSREQSRKFPRPFAGQQLIRGRRLWRLAFLRRLAYVIPRHSPQSLLFRELSFALVDEDCPQSRPKAEAGIVRAKRFEDAKESLLNGIFSPIFPPESRDRSPQ